LFSPNVRAFIGEKIENRSKCKRFQKKKENVSVFRGFSGLVFVNFFYENVFTKIFIKSVDLYFFIWYNISVIRKKEKVRVKKIM
jgi:hypothetical protein